LPGKLTTDPKGVLVPVRKADVERVYWAAASLGLAISTSKSDAGMIARVPEVQAMLDRAMELDESWGAGSLHEFAITLAATKPGGADAATLKREYERALTLSGGNRASLFTTYAEAAAIPAQDVEAFRALLARALAVDTDAVPDWRVANLAAQKRARWLLAHAADYFLLTEDDTSSSGGSR
jgi:predicted anti-sigma-YlaC factor YlaD